ncbi:hypothetical protein AAVH_30310 [Aphelenchoides avenae]|nr:hypothetical protein AAVH_30310 [Aphelenchus avenae]
MKHVKGKAFGLDPQQDSTEMYEPFFEKMDGEYKVLSICLYEQYSLPRRRGSENLLRCVCNSDLCNAATSLKAYFRALA